MTDVRLFHTRVQSLERRILDVEARLDRKLDERTLPAFLIPLTMILAVLIIVGSRHDALQREAMTVLRFGLLPLVTLALGWLLGRYHRARDHETRRPLGVSEEE